VLALDPELAQNILVSLHTLATAGENTGVRPVLVCAPQLRAAVRRLVAPALDRLPVLSYTEISGALSVRSLGTVTGERTEASGSALAVSA
jgi:flagellar biosynthesis protein FlhA